MSDAPPQASVPSPDALMGKMQIIYILYLIPNPITWIVGVVIASNNKAFAPEALQTHFAYAIRTFWIGLIGYIVSFLLMFVFIGILGFIALLVWSVLRSVKGMSLLQERQPIP
ncbi:MAG: hypothetical protein AAFX39_08820, partial [Pseudomonadota bacterium]